MEKHLEQSVLSKLPHGYHQVEKQSLSSTEDDMSMCLFT
jgi:GINS complex subunit 4